MHSLPMNHSGEREPLVPCNRHPLTPRVTVHEERNFVRKLRGNCPPLKTTRRARYESPRETIGGRCESVLVTNLYSVNRPDDRVPGDRRQRGHTRGRRRRIDDARRGEGTSDQAEVAAAIHTDTNRLRAELQLSQRQRWQTRGTPSQLPARLLAAPTTPLDSPQTSPGGQARLKVPRHDSSRLALRRATFTDNTGLRATHFFQYFGCF